jgi:thermitase
MIADLGVHVISVPAQASDNALATLRTRSSVTFAERDSVLQPQEVLSNDPYFLNSGAWNIARGAWGWYQTHTAQAWDITQGDPSVVVAILDTGIKTAGLTDFGGQMSSTWNVMTGTSDATTNAGNQGTYVAGVAGLSFGNGQGNAGVCPRCKLMIVQVGTDSGATISNIAAGLTYAVDHAARVANMSWAGSTDSGDLASATTYAHNKGVLMTALAGTPTATASPIPPPIRTCSASPGRALPGRRRETRTRGAGSSSQLAIFQLLVVADPADCSLSPTARARSHR